MKHSSDSSVICSIRRRPTTMASSQKPNIDPDTGAQGAPSAQSSSSKSSTSSPEEVWFNQLDVMYDKLKSFCAKGSPREDMKSLVGGQLPNPVLTY